MTDLTANMIAEVDETLPKRQAKARPRIKGWPRLHLIYFLLAFFDLAAIGGGLYLSHQLSSVFQASVAKNHEWSERFVSIWRLGDLALALNAPGNDVFQTRDVEGERRKLESAAQGFSAALDRVRAEIAKDVPPALASHPIKTLTFVEQAMRTTVAHGNRTLNEYERGNVERAAESMALMNRNYAAMKRMLNTAIEAVRDIQDAYQSRFEARVLSLKRYEYLIGGAIFVMVSFVMLYGHWVGRFLTRKYRELENAHNEAVQVGNEARDFARQVQSVNAEVTRLNGELEANLRKLGEAQQDSLRNAKMAQLGQLTATVAHELRNPLGAVRTSAFLLQRKAKGKGLDIEPQIERINNGIGRCDGIISQLLDFARTKSLHCEVLTFDDWLAKLVQEEALQLPEAVAIECHLGLGDTQVSFDPARLNRVLINLMSNASEAMVGKGEDPSKFVNPAPKIIISSRLAPRGVEISVADNGPGIPEDARNKILEPLFTTKSFGTGLGLPAVVKILEQHGGGLDIGSVASGGAIFTAWFPISQTQERAA